MNTTLCLTLLFAQRRVLLSAKRFVHISQTASILWPFDVVSGLKFGFLTLKQWYTTGFNDFFLWFSHEISYCKAHFRHEIVCENQWYN